MKSKLKDIVQKKKGQNWKRREEFVKKGKLLSKETMLAEEV
jgi:hypothetical protein